MLAIDDEPMLLRAMLRMLQRDHDVRAAPDAATALTWIASGERFDVILCDMKMPRISGQMFFDQLATIAPDQQRNVVFLSGDNFADDTADFFSRVPNFTLSKPFVVTDLREIVAKVLAQKA